MGDIADDIVDSLFDDSGSRWDDYDPEPDRVFPRRSSFVVCAYCKKSGFYWEKLEGKWRLYVYGTTELHECKAWRKSLKLTRKEKKGVNRLRNNMLRKWKEQHNE